MMGKFIEHDCVSLMSLIHFLCDSNGSTLTAMTFTFLRANSFLILATAPSSVVQTGVKSAGCENRTPQPPASHWWKLTSPSVVCAVKSGAISPNRSAIMLSGFLTFNTYFFRGPPEIFLSDLPRRRGIQRRGRKVWFRAPP